MTENTAPTFNVDIHMAGDIAAAANIIQVLAADKGMCVSLTPQTYVYSGGREEGFKASLINYPRFPREDPETLLDEAKQLASYLMHQLGQHSYTVVSPISTFWFSRRPA